MVTLRQKLTERIYYVNSNVIYEIGPAISTYDKHGVLITADTEGDNDKIEKIYVDGQITYFLDSLIEDGDKYSNGTFTKVVHELDGEQSQEKTYFEYYKYLCEQSIRKGIISNVHLEYDDIMSTNNFSKLGVPEFIVKQKGHTVKVGKTGGGTTATLIDLTEEIYNTWRTEEVAKKVNEAANNSAKAYGYQFIEDMYNTIKSKIEKV